MRRLISTDLILSPECPIKHKRPIRGSKPFHGTIDLDLNVFIFPASTFASHLGRRAIAVFLQQPKGLGPYRKERRRAHPDGKNNLDANLRRSLLRD